MQFREVTARAFSARRYKSNLVQVLNVRVRAY